MAIVISYGGRSPQGRGATDANGAPADPGFAGSVGRECWSAGSAPLNIKPDRVRPKASGGEPMSPEEEIEATHAMVRELNRRKYLHDKR